MLLVLIFLLTGACAYLVMSLSSAPREETVQGRLKRLVQERKQTAQFLTMNLPGTPLDPADAGTGKKGKRRVSESIKEILVGVVEHATRGRRFANTLEVRLQRAGWKWRPAEFLTVQGLFAGGGLGLSVLAAPSMWWLFTALGWAAPLLLLGRSEKKRLKLFEEQLPDALAIISNALRSGYSFLQAMDVVSREMPDPISSEFGLVLREVRVNIPLEEAMNRLVTRIKSPDLDLVVTAVVIQRQVGGNLSEVLEKIGGTIKERIRMIGEIRTLTTQGRFSGWIVSLLPIALAALMQLVSPGYLNPMLENPIGWVLIGIGVVMLSIGVLVIKSMVNMEV